MADKPHRLDILIVAAGDCDRPRQSICCSFIMRILVVDDNRDAAEALAMLLEFNGHESNVAHDGAAAVDAAARLHPDVVLLDIGLPVLDGYEAARQIREQPHERRPLLIAVTGWGEDEHRQRSLDAGFDAHVVKPIDERVLLSLLADLIGGVAPS